MRAEDNRCTAFPLGLSATSSFTVAAIAGLFVFTAAIGVAGVAVGAAERALAGRGCGCLLACGRALARWCGRGGGGAPAGAGGSEAGGGEGGKAGGAEVRKGGGGGGGRALTEKERRHNARLGRILEGARAPRAKLECRGA